MRHLSDTQVLVAEKRAKPSGIPIDQCPTCLSVPDEWDERTNGTYKFNDVEYECNCEEQIALRKHYLLANIPDQYMRLDWDRDYKGSEGIREAVGNYVRLWPRPKIQGMGIELGGASLGVGKTFAATHVGRQLVKADEDVFFVSFDLVISSLVDDKNGIEQRLREANVVILDEIKPPYYEKQKALFSNRFEDIIRYRTNYNAVTITTTNMSEDELQREYPRTYSLLRAKQIRIEMTGEDARQSAVEKENLEMLLNGEVRPIS